MRNMPRFHPSVLAIFLVASACAIETRAPGPIIAREQFATTPDSVRLYYRTIGNGPSTVIAPFALFHESALDSLARSHRVVTYDPRGRGRSDSVPPSKVSLNHLLLDFETVRQAVGAEKVAIIGWSGGGMEMFVYAMRNPQRVGRLVQLAPVAPRFAPYGAQMMEDRTKRTDSTRLAALRREIAAGAFGPDSAALCRAQSLVTTPAMFANPASLPPIPDVCGFRNEHPGRLNTYFGALFQSINGYDWRDSLPRVTIPRLVIHGERDNIPLAGNQEWVTGQANARILVIEGAGHWPHYERPAETIRAISEFLAGRWPQLGTAR